VSLVSVHNEWDPLEEVIVGIAAGARVPPPDRSLRAVEPALAAEPAGAFPEQVVEESERALSELTAALASIGTRVRRPDPVSTGLYHYCPRDVLLTVGDTVIEAPMVLRCRAAEATAYRHLMREYLASGARWIAAPRPALADDMYDPDDPDDPLGDEEPAFDAANVLRVGRDIVYLVSGGGNGFGARWLQAALGPEYRVEAVRGLYPGTHIDTTIAVLRPGLVLLNPERVTDVNLPSVFKGWDRLWCPEPVARGPVGGLAASRWIAMNLLMVSPELAIVDPTEIDLIRLLASHRIEALPLRLPYARTLGGGFHCVTLDVRRQGALEDYRA
jgi:scyllo-inosamine-4-phosphate amidinotransferase 1